MKRSPSDNDNDVFYEERDLMKDGSPSQSCHRSDRKRRRGVIEKRRRDRINNSLTELRRLVPAAFEKQDSAKLEKAEILQMTVDHLKSLHAKGGVTGYNLDTAVLALDYRTVGFRECAAEVARYLISVEGMDIQDPMRLRLMSHLQCYSAQREAAARASLQNSAWGHHHLSSNSSSQQGQYGNNTTVTSNMVQQHPPQVEQLSSAAAHASSLSTYMDTGRSSLASTGDNGSHGGGMSVMRLQPSIVTVPSQMSGISTSSTSQMTAPMISGLPSVHSQFLGVNSMLSPNSFHYSPSSMSHQSVKPYRPWGSELVY